MVLPAFKSSGNVNPCRFVDISGDFTVDQAAHGQFAFGVSSEGSRTAPIPGASSLAAIAEDPFRVYGEGEVCEIEAGFAGLLAGDFVLPDFNGRAVPALDGEMHCAQVLRGQATLNNRALVYISRCRGKINPNMYLARTSNYTVVPATDQMDVFSNEGASGTITFSLPAATLGQEYRFRVAAAQQLRIDPNGTETIALPSTGVQQGAGKYLFASAPGAAVSIRCNASGTWTVMSFVGSWSIEP
jgi:hypothetical protein